MMDQALIAAQQSTAVSFLDPVSNDTAYRYSRHETRDSEQHAESLTDWDQTYSQVSAGNFRGEVVDIGFLGLQVFRETTNQAVHQQGRPMADCHVIGVPLSMSGPGLFSRQQFGRDHVVTCSGNESFSMTTPEQFDVLAVTVPRNRLKKLLALESEHEGFTDQPCVLRPAQECITTLRNCLTSLLDPAEFDGALLRNHQIQRIMASAVMSSVVSTLMSARPAEDPNRSFRARSHMVKGIVDWVMSRPEDPPTIEEICLQFNIGRRLLNYSFQEVLGTNPLSYLRSMRLNAVRRELRKGDTTIAVKDVAARWGFWHLPRFSNEYRKLFGELPSETLRHSARLMV